MIDSENSEKMHMEAEKGYLQDVYVQMRECYEEEARQRVDAEEALQRAREEKGWAAVYSCDTEATMISLCNELMFLKKLFAEEKAELQSQLQVANISVDVELSRPNLSTDL